jgi:hypothetical protein
MGKTARRRALAALASATLGGCAVFGSAVGLGGRLSGDSEGVVVKGALSPLEATPLAVAHCSRFKRAAQYEKATPTGRSFRCV